MYRDDREKACGIDPLKIIQYHGNMFSPYITKHGHLRPNITFFGEAIDPHLQHRAKKDLYYSCKQSSSCVDLVFIMGTSLKISPFNLIPTRVHGHVQRVIINREIPQTRIRKSDLVLLGEVDEIVNAIKRKMNK